MSVARERLCKHVRWILCAPHKVDLDFAGFDKLTDVMVLDVNVFNLRVREHHEYLLELTRHSPGEYS